MSTERLSRIDPITHPTLLRHELAKVMPKADFPIGYDYDSQIHIIGANLEMGCPTTVLANTGDFVMNDKDKYPVSENDPDGPFRADDFDDGMIGIAMTKPGDTFVMVDDETGYNARLAGIVQDGFARIGISLTDTIVTTDSLSEWQKQNNPDRISPLTISPRMMRNAPIDPELATLQGLHHMAAYAKTEFQRLCEAHGVPTPRTLHQRMTEHNHGYIAWDALTSLPGYDEYVVSHGNGIGGSGVFMTPKDQIKQTLQSHFSPRDEVMIQGRMMDIISPCVRGYIGTDSHHLIGMTKQKIRNGGVYAGNEWFEGIDKAISELSPNFEDVYTRTFEALQQVGVRGVVNVDILINKNTGEATAREVNVRPAFSHVLGVISRKGVINDLPVTQLCSTFYSTIPDNLYDDPDFLKILNASSGCDMSVLPILRYREDEKSYLVYAANKNVAPEELDEMQHEVESRIARYVDRHTSSA